jgi:hypothetical protein
LGISMYLVALPLAVMVVSLLLGGGNLAGNASPYVICNQNTPACTQGGDVTITCASTIINAPCALGGTGPFSDKPCEVPPFPAPAYCVQNFAGGLLANKGFTTLLPAGQSITVPAAVASGQFTSNSGAFFSFGLVSLSSNGFITALGVIVGVAALAGLTIFSSGEQSESIHILFMGGIMIGIWLFLSGLDGVLSGNPASFFVQLNSALTSPGNAQFGTELYIGLTFMYLMGFMTMVKRGGGGGE